jgi:putative molybdopterin biosynthesis protein
MPMKQLEAALDQLARQDQFLEVVDRDEARARFHQHLKLLPLGSETIPLSKAVGRVLAAEITAGVDVPAFDRSSVDGFAVRATDTAGASAQTPALLRLNPEILTPGVEAQIPITAGTATLIATGGMLPRGADAVVMVEHTDTRKVNGDTWIEVSRPSAAGQFVAYAGNDLARGEIVLRLGQLLTSREIGMLAAVGRAEVEVWRKPRVAIISSGDEIISLGHRLRPGGVYDSNAAILAAAIEEAGGAPNPLGIGRDDEAVLSRFIDQGLACADMVLVSGGTSKGAGDLCYRAVARFKDPGVLVHGVALKPGKPVCLAVTGGKPLVILPGFPTSAIFTFHEFVAPVIRAFAGLPPERADTVSAILPVRVSSERGRTEFMMVSLVAGESEGSLTAYPIAKGSGAVTSFSQADGFFTIGRHEESVAAGTMVNVQIIGRSHALADLVIIGSHCVGLDVILSQLRAEGLEVKVLNVGSMGGLAAAKRGECDIAGIHLMDVATGEYNRPFLTPALDLIPGYRRMQGLVFRKGDERFEGRAAPDAIAAALADPGCLMVSRNAGSGTRILIDRLLNDARPPGYWSQPKSHNAVAAAVAQNRADWGVAIETVAWQYDLGFVPLQDEHYDFAVPQARIARQAVLRFRATLNEPEVQAALTALGFKL